MAPTWRSGRSTIPVFCAPSSGCLLLLELAAPLLLVVRRERTRYVIVGALIAFHVITYLAISIIFLPHVVALTAFLPLERLGRREAPS